MKKVFLIHGYKGEPNGGWRPWLMGELARLDVWACALSLPMNDGYPKKEEWVKEMERIIGDPNEDIFLVGHSLGVPTILRYLENLPINNHIGGAVLVSGPIHVLDLDKYRPIDNFIEKSFDFQHIKKVCKNFKVIHAKDDPNVPFSHAEDLSRDLACELVALSQGGHLNGSSGYYELPEVLGALKNISKI